MKYYSTRTHHIYDTENELLEAEAKLDASEQKKKESEAKREAEREKITELIKQANEALDKATTAMKEYVRKYGSFKGELNFNAKSLPDIMSKYFWF